MKINLSMQKAIFKYWPIVDIKHFPCQRLWITS